MIIKIKSVSSTFVVVTVARVLLRRTENLLSVATDTDDASSLV